eukprot:4665624-Amphidinium_carterae.2
MTLSLRTFKQGAKLWVQSGATLCVHTCGEGLSIVQELLLARGLAVEVIACSGATRQGRDLEHDANEP